MPNYSREARSLLLFRLICGAILPHNANSPLTWMAMDDPQRHQPLVPLCSHLPFARRIRLASKPIALANSFGLAGSRAAAAASPWLPDQLALGPAKPRAASLIGSSRPEHQGPPSAMGLAL
jgi:hypothetical protein